MSLKFEAETKQKDQEEEVSHEKIYDDVEEQNE
jgi:hypothetical protein